MKIWISEREEICANCKHYVQHYTCLLERFTPCNAGHCVYPRLKARKPGQTCERFEFGHWEDKWFEMKKEVVPDA